MAKFLLIGMGLFICACQSNGYRPFPYAKTDGDSPNGISIFKGYLEARGFKVTESIAMDSEKEFDIVFCFDPYRQGLNEEAFLEWENYTYLQNSYFVYVTPSFMWDYQFWLDQKSKFYAEDDGPFFTYIATFPQYYHVAPPFPHEWGGEEGIFELNDPWLGPTSAKVHMPASIDEDEYSRSIADTENGSFAIYHGEDLESNPPAPGLIILASPSILTNYALVHSSNVEAVDHMLNRFLIGKEAAIISLPSLTAGPPQKTPSPLAFFQVFPLNWILLQFLICLAIFLWFRFPIIGYPQWKAKSFHLDFSNHIRALGSKLMATGQYLNSYILLQKYLKKEHSASPQNEEEAIAAIQKLME